LSFFGAQYKSFVSVSADTRLVIFACRLSLQFLRASLHKLINLRTRFFYIMATFAGTLCFVYTGGGSASRLLHTVFPRVLFGRALRQIPVHEYRYVPAHTSPRYAYLFITCAATGMSGPASTLLSWGTRTYWGDILSIMALGWDLIST